MNNVKTDEPTLKTISLDGVELTPVNVFGNKEQEEQFIKAINSSEYTNFTANKVQEQINKNLGLNKNIQQPKNLMIEKQIETNELIESTNKQLLELQNQLNDSRIQLKQANDKIASQTLVIKQLKADLKEENDKANKISSKDWKSWIIGGIIGALVPIIIQIIYKLFL